jgi:hypothetical protein
MSLHGLKITLELRLGDLQATKLICDNQAALHIASNSACHEKAKHIGFVKSKDQLLIGSLSLSRVL